MDEQRTDGPIIERRRESRPTPTPSSIEAEIQTLLASDDASRAELVVALRRLEQEIAKRRRIELELRESQTLYTDLVDSQSAGIYRIRVRRDADWRSPTQPAFTFEFLSDQYCQIHGTTREVLLRDPGLLVRQIQEDHVEEFARQYEAASRKLEPFLWQGPVLVQGQVRWIRYEARPRLLEDEAILWTGVAMDITEAQRLELQLRQVEKMDAIGHLADGIAHDFNNMLGGIVGYAELLLERMPEPHLRYYVDRILKTALRASDLTAKLLAFARKGKSVSIPVNIHDLIHEVVGLLHHSIDRRIVTRQHLDAFPSWVMGDPAQLQNALLNLALNARDAMPFGGQLLFATSVLTREAEAEPIELPAGRYILIRLKDTGIGMSPETQQHLFEPFFTTKERGKGTGLGLPAVYGVVRNHHGAIRIHSEPDQGTTVELHLPLIDAPSASAWQLEAVPPPSPSPIRILLVDDEEYVREPTAELLRRLGYAVETCADGEEATRHYAAHHQEIDLVILDMVMPKMGGKDTFLAMRRENPTIRALLASGYSIDGEAQEILNAGVLGFLQKPFQSNVLARKVAEILKK